MTEINDIQAGKAGEYLVCADLILNGHIAYLSEQALAYDVVVDAGGRLIKVQVKTTRAPKAVYQQKDHTPAYLFNIRKMGNGGRRSYESKEVDVFALVALDTRTIGYIAERDARQTMVFRIRDFEGMYFDERTKDRRATIAELRAQGVSFREIAKRLNIDASQAHRIAHGEGTSQHGLYLDELNFKKAIGAK